MGIGGLGDYTRYLQNYKVPTIPSVSAAEIQRPADERGIQRSADEKEIQRPEGEREIQRSADERGIQRPADRKEMSAVPENTAYDKIRETDSKENKGSNARLEDISITFQKQDSFDYIGRDSDINHLDMQKAISDMRKDQVLQQYQYFVGNAGSAMEDGIVIIKTE